MHGGFLNIEVLSIVVSVLVNVLVDDVIRLVPWDGGVRGAGTAWNGRRKVFCLKLFIKLLCVREGGREGEREREKRKNL